MAEKIYESILRVRNAHGHVEREFITQHGGDRMMVVTYDRFGSIQSSVSVSLDEAATAIHEAKQVDVQVGTPAIDYVMRYEQRGECVWTPDDDGVYDTTCGNRWFFDSGTASENQAGFCPYCGKTLLDGADAATKTPAGDTP